MTQRAGPNQPTLPTERIVVLDVLRGFALFGVLIAHFTSALPTPHEAAERGTNWWLARHRFGPLEWLWRTMTYGHPPRPAAAEPAL